MKKKIVLSKVVDAFYHISTNNHIYVNLENGNIISIDDGMTSEEKEEMFVFIEENSNDYLALPTQFELDGYNRMKRFIKTLGETKYIKEFEKAIKGKGAFRRFKDLLIAHDIREYWHSFEHDEYIELAIKLLEKNNVFYDNDLENDFDTLVEKEIEKNEEYLKMFESYLTAEGLAERTIKKHLDNMDDYLNGYLLHREIITAVDGINDVSNFFGSWYPRFLIPTKDQTLSFASSIKKFYEFFLKEELVTLEEYNDLLKTIDVCIG